MPTKFAFLFITVALAGCPSAQDEATVVEKCSKTGERCRIAKGQLGVCMMNGAGEFNCAPQH